MRIVDWGLTEKYFEYIELLSNERIIVVGTEERDKYMTCLYI